MLASVTHFVFCLYCPSRSVLKSLVYNLMFCSKTSNRFVEEPTEVMSFDLKNNSIP